MKAILLKDVSPLMTFYLENNSNSKPYRLSNSLFPTTDKLVVCVDGNCKKSETCNRATAK